MKNKFYAIAGAVLIAAALLVPSIALAAAGGVGAGGVAGASSDNAAAIEENAAAIDANSARISGNDARIKALEALMKNMTSTSCPEGEFLIGFERDGTPICAPGGADNPSTTVNLPDFTAIDLDTGNTQTCRPKELCKLLMGADFSFSSFVKGGPLFFTGKTARAVVDPRLLISYEDVDENTRRSLFELGGNTGIPSARTTLIIQTDTGALFKAGNWRPNDSKAGGVTFDYQLLVGKAPCPPDRKCEIIK